MQAMQIQWKTACIMSMILNIFLALIWVFHQEVKEQNGLAAKPAEENGAQIGSHGALKYQYNFNDQFDTGLAKFIASRWIDPPSKQPITKQEVKQKYFSQLGQDKLVDKLLGEKRNGFFIECGAYDGKQYSNSLYFELHRNWTGLLIEPSQPMYQKLLANRRRSYSINVGLSPNEKSQVIGFGVPIRAGADAAGLVGHSQVGNLIKCVVPTQCFPLYAILQSIGQTHIDYFSLDVEGAELDVLKTIPFDKVTIDVFTIEYKFSNHSIIPELSMKNLNGFRKFFAETKLYKEVTTLRRGKDPEELGFDVVFKRI